MKELRFRLFIILGAIVLSVVLLLPTYYTIMNNRKVNNSLATIRKEVLQNNPKIAPEKLETILKAKEDSIKNTNPDFSKDKEKSIKLGLDLQGGMYIVMEVNTAKLLEKLAKDPDANFTQALKQAEQQAKLSDEDIVTLFTQNLKNKGIRLSRYFGNMRDDDDKISKTLVTQSEDAVSRAMEIIKNRVDQYGVSEPSIQRQGSRRIIVELPGVSKEEEAKSLLQGQALLEFKLLKEPQLMGSLMTKIDETLAGKVITDSTASDSSKAAGDSSAANKDTSKKELSKEEFAKQHPFFSLFQFMQGGGEPLITEENKDKLDAVLERPDVQKVLPNNVQFLVAAKPFPVQGKNFYPVYMVNKDPELTGGNITDAQSNIDQSSSRPIVTMQMNAEGAREWARITGANINKRIAIVLDNLVYSAPVVRTKISGGNSQIDGMKDLQEAKLLEIVLKAGALPAPVDIIEERTVGPSLGQDSVNAGFNSMWVGFVVVAGFMWFYYKKAGAVADIALFFVILFILAVLAGFHGNLTLPGIAGMVLTMGMAVDANVLIYERIREELATGKTMKAAVDSGFSNSFSAIIDSQLTTFFTGVVLYQFGSGPIVGFALTLMIGILTSLFGALVITRVIMDYMVVKGQKISLG